MTAHGVKGTRAYLDSDDNATCVESKSVTDEQIVAAIDELGGPPVAYGDIAAKLVTLTGDHFAYSLYADVRKGALPVGWYDSADLFYSDFGNDHTGRITAFADAENGAPLGSVEVAGWYWDPRAIVIR